MRKVVLWMSVSIDGFFAGPNGELDWHQVDVELHQFFNDQLRGMGAFLNGRVNWELMAEFWPTADEDPDAGAPITEFAQIWRDMPKVLYSRTRTAEAGWNTTIVRDIVAAEVQALKAQPGGDLVVGGAIVANEFRRLGLIDEYCLFVHPVVVGQGRRPFEPSDQPEKLRLTETKSFGNGVVFLRYAA